MQEIYGFQLPRSGLLEQADTDNSFDEMAWFYDLVICNRFYNCFVWGYSTADYAPFTSKALNSSRNGWVLDAGCGSLAFNAKIYADYSNRPVVLLDHSLKLLKTAKSRLVKLYGGMPQNMIFLLAYKNSFIIHP